MNCQIVTGDALELIPTLEDGSVQLVVTSPPYPGQRGNAMTPAKWMDWYDQWMTLLTPKMKPDSVIAVNVAFKRTPDGWFDRSVFNVAWGPWLQGWHLLDLYVYGKTNPPPNGALTFCDPPGWEFVFVLTNAARPQDVLFQPVRAPYAPKSIRRTGKKAGQLYSNQGRKVVEPHPDGARQTTLMLMSKSADQNRPSAKGISFPREFPYRFILQYTRPDDLVLDPFCGVGTAIRLAGELDRRGIGFDNDPEEAEKARAWLAEPVQGEMLRSVP